MARRISASRVVVTVAMLPFVLVAVAAVGLLVDGVLDGRAGRQFARIRLNADAREVQALMGRPDVTRPCGESLWWGGDGDYRGKNDGRCVTEARYEHFLSAWAGRRVFGRWTGRQQIPLLLRVTTRFMSIFKPTRRALRTLSVGLLGLRATRSGLPDVFTLGRPIWRRTLAAAFAAACAASPAQEPAQGRVVLEPHWHAGDHVVYLVTHSLASTRYGAVRPVSPDQRMLMTLDVRAADTAVYLIDLHKAAAPGVPVPEPADPDEAALVHEALSTPLQLRVDVHGRVLEVVNWEQERDLARRWSDRVFERMQASGAAPELLARAERSRARAIDEPQLRAAQASDAEVLFSMLGQTYDRAAPIVAAGEFAMPQGGAPMPPVLYRELVGFDPPAGTASAALLIVGVDPAGTREQMRLAVDRFAKASRALPADVPFPEFDTRLIYRAVVDYESGWPRSARLEQSSRGPGFATLETRSFERQ